MGLSALVLLLALQRTGGKAQVGGAVDGGGHAGAGAGTGVVHGDVGLLLLKGLDEHLHHLFHGGGTVGVHHAAELLGLAGLAALGIGVGAVGIVRIAAVSAAAGEHGQGHGGGQGKTE